METVLQQPNIQAKEELDGRYVVLSKIIEANFNKVNMKNSNIFMTDVTDEAIQAAFLSGFADDQAKRNTCSCCLDFIRRYGRLVFIEKDAQGVFNLVSAMWSAVDKVDPYFRASFEAMKALVEKANIEAVWYSRFETLGQIELNTFNHLQVQRAIVPQFSRTKTPGQAISESREDYRILSEALGFVKRRIKEKGGEEKFEDASLNPETVKKVLIYFKNERDMRHEKKYIETLEWFIEFQKTAYEMKDRRQKARLVWHAVATLYKDRTHIGSTVLGEFIKGIEKGMSFDLAKKRWKEQTDSLTKGRAQTPPTQGNVMRAEKVFEALGLASALKRRFATLEEMVYKVWEPKEVKEAKEEAKQGLFGHLKTKEDVAPKVTASQLPTTIDGGIMSWVRFKQEVLATADNLFVRVTASRMDFMTVSTSVDPEAAPLMAWDDENARNPLAAYRYDKGSFAQQWNLQPFTLVPVNAIVVVPHEMKEPGAATGDNVTLIMALEGAKDTGLQQIPLAASWVHNDLHEIRSTLENFFTSGKMEPQPEGLEPFGGLAVHNHPGGGLGYEIHVVTNGIKTKYLIDRYS